LSKSGKFKKDKKRPVTRNNQLSHHSLLNYQKRNNSKFRHVYSIEFITKEELESNEKILRKRQTENPRNGLDQSGDKWIKLIEKNAKVKDVQRSEQI
jgi:hypothetical protein